MKIYCSSLKKPVFYRVKTGAVYHSCKLPLNTKRERSIAAQNGSFNVLFASGIYPLLRLWTKYISSWITGIWLILGLWALASCHHTTSETIAIDQDLKADLVDFKQHYTNDKQASLREEQQQKKAQVEQFLSKDKISIPPLGNTKLRPISPQTAITAAVEALDITGEADPIIIGTNKIAWPYGLSQPTLACARLRVCSIALQAGEEVLDIVTGDSERWNITLARSGDTASVRPHLIVKPLSEGNLQTNLLVTTTRRTYHIDLTSVDDGTYTPQIEFYYPQEPYRAASQELTSTPVASPLVAAPAVAAQSTLVALNQMHFDYHVKGDKDLAWYPVRVFDDGQKVFIQMPERVSATEAPVFLIDQKGKQELVNYRFNAPYYIIDRLFDKGILILGDEDDQEMVRIEKQRKGLFASWRQ